MAATIVGDRWVAVLAREYLESFIADGGAAIKCAVPMEEDARQPTLELIRAAASERRYVYAHLDAATVRVHMIDQVFFAVAEQLPWMVLCEGVLEALAAKAGFSVAAPGSAPLLSRLADANGIDANVIKMELWRGLERSVYKNRHMVKDVRVALLQLCKAALVGGDEGRTTFRVIVAWLTGRNQQIAAVKPYFIFNRINRTNARPMFESLLHFIRLAGFPGALVTIDLARLTEARRPRDSSQYYTKSALLDAYELLRQFLDSTDRLAGCLMVLMPGAAILDDEDSRSLAVYTALKNRIYDEVRDKHLVNPMASLVRLAVVEQGVA